MFSAECEFIVFRFSQKKRFAAVVLGILVVRCLAPHPQSIAAQSNDETNASPIDFRTQIWPIIESRCLHCHGPTKQKGELRLDRLEFVQAGGHTGNAILADRPEKSELFLRVSSDDPKYRMPSLEPPLSAEQIELLREWILNGGAWADVSSGLTTAPTQYAWLVWLEPYLAMIERLFGYVRPVAIPLVGFLLVIVWIERTKRKSKRPSGGAIGSDNSPASDLNRTAAWPAKGLARIRREWYLIGILLLVIIAFAFHHEGEARSYQSLLARANETIADLNRQDESPVAHGPNGGPVPPRPKHIKQLGGTYYRGNDERDPRLFNGGFYRTATLRVSLTNSSHQPVAWGDQVGDEPLFVTVEIERAREATPALFTDGIMETIFLSQQVALLNRPESADTPAYFQNVEPGVRWVAHYPIRSGGAAPAVSGMIYLYKGRFDGGEVDGKFHFGISYDVRIEGGQVSRESEIWMGSLSVPAGLIIPPPDRMVLNEWFDFRPLPEIEGENSKDPGLLGIPEYVK